MREVKGYVSVAEFRGTFNTLYFLHGKSSKGEAFESFSLNGMMPYSSLREARAGCEAVLKFHDAISTIPAKIRMEIAETPKELTRLEKESGLVVVMTEDGGGTKLHHLLGPAVKGKRDYGTIPGAFLRDTNFTTYTREKGKRNPYERALYQAREVNRQAQNGAALAKFKLTRLEKYRLRKK